MKRISILLLISTFLSPIFPAEAVDGIGVGDITVPAVYALGFCGSATELDCLQSVELKNADGTFTAMTYSGSLGYSKFVDNNGNEATSANLDWKTDAVTISIKADLETPEHIIIKEDGQVKLRGGSLRLHVFSDDPINTFLRIKVRTSWLKPMSVQLKVKDSNFLQSKIPGGNLWTMEGSGLLYSDYAQWADTPEQNEFTKQADKEEVLFDLFIHHADSRPGYSYFPPTCADTGYTVQSNNTNATGEPVWNLENQSLEFGIKAPHLDIHGNLNKGYFKLWATDKYLDCKFPGNTVTKAANVKIEIIDENGKQQVATTTVQNKNGMLYVFAYGFHFSSPTIVLTAGKTTITCLKGATIKKVSAISPLCPKGYKKR